MGSTITVSRNFDVPISPHMFGHWLEGIVRERIKSNDPSENVLSDFEPTPNQIKFVEHGSYPILHTYDLSMKYSGTSVTLSLQASNLSVFRGYFYTKIVLPKKIKAIIREIQAETATFITSSPEGPLGL